MPTAWGSCNLRLFFNITPKKMSEETAIAEEVVETTTAESTEVVETETVEDDHLTPEVAKNVSKYGSMDDAEKTAYIEKLKKGGRNDALKAIQETYGIKFEANEDPEIRAEKDRIYEEFQQQKAAKNWLKSQGITADVEKTLLNKEFVKQYHSSELSKVTDPKLRTELALSRSIGKKAPDAEKRDKAKTFTQTVAGSPKKAGRPKDSFITAALNQR